MSLQMIQVLEGIFAVLTLIGFDLDSAPRWAGWLCCCLFLALDTWRSSRVGEISTGPSYRWYGFTFSRDESPGLFTCILLCYSLLTLACFLGFLFSL